VGGGTENVSVPLVSAVIYAKEKGMKVLGIVGRDGGYTKQHGDCVVVVPTVSDQRVTPHTESFQSVILHYLVSHPAIQKRKAKW
jgi:D-sedoheptulose 7-phosphate isomerase